MPMKGLMLQIFPIIALKAGKIARLGKEEKTTQEVKKHVLEKTRK